MSTKQKGNRDKHDAGQIYSQKHWLVTEGIDVPIFRSLTYHGVGSFFSLFSAGVKMKKSWKPFYFSQEYLSPLMVSLFTFSIAST